MIYIYDTVIEGQTTEITRYGGRYKLAARTKMKDQCYYTFKSSGRESLIVVPRFAEQYRKAEQIIEKFGKCKDSEALRLKIVKKLDKDVIEEHFPSEVVGETGLYVYTIFYKDISLELHYENQTMELQDDFQIKENNIFGNGLTVTMNMDMEE